MYNRINFFEKLCKYNVTNKELSEAIGVSTGNISDWKSGKSKPNIDAIAKIANYLDCSVDYLLGLSIGESSVSVYDMKQYDMQQIANRIELRMNDCGYKKKTMLTELNLGINLLSHLAKGQVISSVNLAKIADYLDCSVDYLLGRTDNPTSHKTPRIKNITVSPSNDTDLQVAYGFKSGPVIEDDDETTTSK